MEAVATPCTQEGCMCKDKRFPIQGTLWKHKGSIEDDSFEESLDEYEASPIIKITLSDDHHYMFGITLKHDGSKWESDDPFEMEYPIHDRRKGWEFKSFRPHIESFLKHWEPHIKDEV